MTCRVLVTNLTIEAGGVCGCDVCRTWTCMMKKMMMMTMMTYLMTTATAMTPLASPTAALTSSHVLRVATSFSAAAGTRPTQPAPLSSSKKHPFPRTTHPAQAVGPDEITVSIAEIAPLHSTCNMYNVIVST